MLLLAFGILSSLLLQACKADVDSQHLATFRYVNETSHTIEIKEWRKKVEKTYKLEPLGELKFETIMSRIRGVL